MIYVIDSSNRDRVEETKEELHILLKRYDLKEIPLLVLANKQDLAGSMQIDEICHRFELQTVERRVWHIEGCSAITGCGIWEGLGWLGQVFNKKGI